MPVKTKRNKRASNGLSEAALMYFSYGAFFEGEPFEEQTPPEERAEIWKAHRAAIISRWRLENPHQPPDFKTWGEELEKKDADFADEVVR